MTVTESKLFQIEFLERGCFPKLDSRGKEACRHEIRTWGFKQFLRDGWSTLCHSDELLKEWLEKLISIEVQGKSPNEAKTISRSIKYGAALSYYTLQIQAEESQGKYIMPKASKDQRGSLRFDLSQENVQDLSIFLVGYDEELAAMFGGFFTNREFLKMLKVEQISTYLGAYFTYFVLASKAESSGMEQVYGS